MTENGIRIRKARELEEENQKLKEKLSEITMVSDDEKQSIEHILELEEENRRLSEKNKIYSNALVQEKEKNRKLKEDNDKLQTGPYKYSYIRKLRKQNKKLEEENKSLKESLDIATKCSSKEEDGIIRLSEENKKLKEENDKIKKRVKEHTTYSVKAEFIKKFGE